MTPTPPRGGGETPDNIPPNYPKRGAERRAPIFSKETLESLRGLGNVVQPPNHSKTKGGVPLFDKSSTSSNSAIELLTIPEVAGILKISVSGVRHLYQARHLPFHKVGGSIRFSKSDIESYLGKRRVEAID